jgi:hypothetical protein
MMIALPAIRSDVSFSGGRVPLHLICRVVGKLPVQHSSNVSGKSKAGTQAAKASHATRGLPTLA